MLMLLILKAVIHFLIVRFFFQLSRELRQVVVIRLTDSFKQKNLQMAGTIATSCRSEVYWDSQFWKVLILNSNIIERHSLKNFVKESSIECWTASVLQNIESESLLHWGIIFNFNTNDECAKAN